MTKAVIFDFDGTLCDSERAWEELLEKTYSEANLFFDRATYGAAVGGPSDALDCFSPLATSLGRSREEIETELERIVVDGLVLQGPSPDVLQLLACTQEAGLRCAIASNGRPKDISTILTGWGLHSCFELIVGRSAGCPQKPHPWPYSEALRRLGLQPSDALAIEDSINGALAATHAGIRCFLLGDHPQHIRGATLVASLTDPVLLSAITNL